MRRVLLSLLPLFTACGSSTDSQTVANEPAGTSGPVAGPVAAPTATSGAAPGAAPAAAARMATTPTRGDTGEVNPRLLRRFKPVRASLALPDQPAAPALVVLGRMLFFDTRLSRDRDLSCNSCHHLDKYGVDNEPTSPGAKGVRGRRNSPSVYHAAGEFTAFWTAAPRASRSRPRGRSSIRSRWRCPAAMP